MNRLCLNPRMPEKERALFQKAWASQVEGKFQNHTGIVTSGSSGRMGSIVLLSENALESSANAVNQRLNTNSRDVWIKTLPDFHVGGLGIRVRAKLSGTRVVEMSDERWDAIAFVEKIKSENGSLCALVPTQLFDIVGLQLRAPASLRFAVIGGGRLEESLRIRAIQLGWPVIPSYGLTEACSQVATAISVDDSRLMPLSHVEIRAGPKNRLEIKSAALLSARLVFDGAEFKLETPVRDGWFETSDVGHVNADGSLSVEGRSGDFVKIGGEGVVLSRLEEKLASLQLALRVKEDVVIMAARDPRLGAKIVALSSKDSQAVRSLFEAFNSEVAPYERIRETHIVDAIPRSAIGKLLRVQALQLVGLESATDV